MKGRVGKLTKPALNREKVELHLSQLQDWSVPPRVCCVLGDARYRLEGTLLALHVGADGNAWSIEEPGVLRHWLIAAGKEYSRIVLSEFEMMWAFSPRQPYLASAGNDISIWDYNRGEWLYSITQSSWVNTLAFSPDGRWLASGHDDGKVLLWDVKQGICVRTCQAGEVPVSVIAYSPDGNTLAVADEWCAIHLWHVHHGLNIGHLDGHTDRICDLSWHPDCQHLASSAWDTTARLWNCDTGKCLYLLNGHSQQVHRVLFTPSGQLLATVDCEQTIRIWEPFVGKVLHRLRGHHGEVTCIAFTPTGKALISGGTDGNLVVWNVSEGKKINQTVASLFNTARLSIRPDLQQLIGVSGSREVHVWNYLQNDADHVAIPVESEATTVIHSSDGQTFFTGHANGSIHAWESQTNVPLQTLIAHRFSISALVYEPQQRLLASAGGGDGYVYLWQPPKSEPVLLIPEAAQGGTVEDLVFVPGKPWLLAAGVDWLCSGSSDGVIQLWDYRLPGRLQAADYGATRLAIHPQGSHFAAALLTNSIGVFAVDSMNLLFELEGHQGRINALSYSPTGQWLISGCEDGLIRIWNTQLGTLQTCVELDVPIRDLKWIGTENLICSANANATYYLIDLVDVFSSGFPACQVKS